MRKTLAAQMFTASTFHLISPNDYSVCYHSFRLRQSGVTDHYALNDEHALSIARSIASSLNYTSKVSDRCVYILF